MKCYVSVLSPEKVFLLWREPTHGPRVVFVCFIASMCDKYSTPVQQELLSQVSSGCPPDKQTHTQTHRYDQFYTWRDFRKMITITQNLMSYHYVHLLTDNSCYIRWYVYKPKRWKIITIQKHYGRLDICHCGVFVYLIVHHLSRHFQQ